MTRNRKNDKGKERKGVFGREVGLVVGGETESRGDARGLRSSGKKASEEFFA